MTKIFFLIACTLYSFAGNAKIYVMGYPKSGNNLLCYCLANILNKTIYFNCNEPIVLYRPNALNHYGESNGEIEESGNDGIYLEHHSYGLALHQANQAREFLIIIVRDYHESFTREEIQILNGDPFAPEILLDKVKHLRPLDSIEDCYNTNAIDLINILRCYDKWNPKTRCLIYYEDLLTDFDSTMRKCMKKLRIPEHLLAPFLLEKEERLQESLNNYRYGETMSGNDLKYYQKHWLTPEIAIQMDEEIMLKFPYYWGKYLKRYQYHP